MNRSARRPNLPPAGLVSSGRTGPFACHRLLTAALTTLALVCAPAVSASATGADDATALDDLATMCVGDSIVGYAFKRSTLWTTTGQFLGAIVRGEPRLRATLDAQRIGAGKPATAVRVATGVQDDIVPHAQARQLAVDWCEKGANVTYDAIHLPDLGDGLLTNHLMPLITDQGRAISWLTDRLSGRAANSNCWSMPVQP
ncbi:lipase family protein [Goodfellowiella coeruleoviolacea]|uniref:Secretory lipase n=1 Tax=Goodfellowiella coeruleoviolacea TaxID=334858 RepID=A0AAE3GGD3_9PSEU|nr:lipase family protein [Goodfellowiella coeruleoviolacea]MCP2167756.1 Secretory lipase [Goodfellowiella coeruleoviolacea]